MLKARNLEESRERLNFFLDLQIRLNSYYAVLLMSTVMTSLAMLILSTMFFALATPENKTQFLFKSFTSFALEFSRNHLILLFAYMSFAFLANEKVAPPKISSG